MRLEQDHYDVLGVTPTASDQEIKKAFRGLARRLHPDVAADPPAEDLFHEVVEAYEVLSNPRRRRLYDRLGFSSRRRGPRATPGVPPVGMTLEWYEAERGTSKPVEFEEIIACAACDGSGVPRGVTPASCVRCRGTGRLHQVTESDTLRLLNIFTCTACEGRGHDVPLPCEDCAGTGTRTSPRTFRLRVPAGVRDGDVLQVEGIAQRFRLEVGARPRDSSLVLLMAGVALACAVGLLLFLLIR